MVAITAKCSYMIESRLAGVPGYQFKNYMPFPREDFSQADRTRTSLQSVEGSLV